MSGNNRNKKLRFTTLNEIQYAWVVESDCDGDGSNLLKIWKDKKLIYDDMISGGITITPSVVKGKIKCSPKNNTKP